MKSIIGCMGLILALLSCRSLFLYHPSKDFIAVPSQIGIKYENIYFYTLDKIKLNGWYIQSELNLGTVIFCHGNAGNITTNLNTIRLIHSLGFNLFIFDYRGYGKSEGAPNFNGLKLDSIAAYQYVIEVLKESPEKVIIWGRSLGGSVAAYLSSQKKAKILILESTFISLKKIAADFFFLFPYIGFVTEEEYNTFSYIQNSSCPILGIHSVEDEVIPFSHGGYLYENSMFMNSFVKLRGPHNFGFMIAEDDYIRGITYFLEKYYFK